MENENIVTFHVRTREIFWEKVRKEAQKSGLSTHKWVIQCLQNAMVKNGVEGE